MHLNTDYLAEAGRTQAKKAWSFICPKKYVPKTSDRYPTEAQSWNPDRSDSGLHFQQNVPELLKLKQT
jgi:hypothetical protein